MDKVKYLSFVKSIEKPGEDISLESQQKRMVHACMGLSGETGEVVDILKKHVIYGKELDKAKVIEECGDVLYYMAVLLDTVGSDIDTALFENYKKLSARYYKGAYSNDQAIERKDKA